MNENVKFIKANKEDCYTLSKIKKEVWNTTYRGIYSDKDIDEFDYKKHEQKFIEGLEGLYLIKFDNNVIGYFCFSYPKYPYKDYQYCLNSLYILKDYQGNGIGKKVFDFIIKYCNDNDIGEFFTSANKYNEKAQKFYVKMGGVLENVRYEGEDKSSHQFDFVFKVNK